MVKVAFHTRPFRYPPFGTTPMRCNNLRSWLGRSPGWGTGRTNSKKHLTSVRAVPALNKLEDRTVMNGYLALGAGQGAPPLVAIRIDRIDSLTTSPTPP